MVGESDSRLGVFGYESGVRFSKGSGNFLGPKANFEIKTSWIVAKFLAHKPDDFGLLTDSFLLPFLKLLNLWSWMQTGQTQNSCSAPKSYRDFRETGPRSETSFSSFSPPIPSLT